MTAEPENVGLHGRNVRRWVGAATLITALHVCGGTWAMRHWQADEPIEEPMGAIVVEISAVASTALNESVDHGPLMHENIPTQQSVQQERQETAEDTPEEPLSRVPDPEVAIEKKPPAEQQDEKPKEEVAKTETQTQDARLAAPKTMAPAQIEAPVADKSAAPRSGSSTTSNTAVRTWKSALVMHLNKHKRYPSAARSRSLAGDVHVRFSMDRSGQLIRSRILRSSGSSLLDEEAMAMFKRASPLPLPPPAVTGEILEYSVPIHFRM